MGKTYGKPHIYIESFQLNAAVAAGCSEEAQAMVNVNMEDCKLEGDYIIGAACEVDAVGLPGSNDSNPDNACYHAMLATLSEQFLVS